MRDAVHHLHCCCCCCVSKKADRPRSTRSLVLCSRCNQAAQAPRSRRADQFYSSVEAHRSKSSAMCSIDFLGARSKKACCEEGERDVKKARRQRPGQTTPQDISIVVTRHRQQQCIILPHRLLMMPVGHLFAPHDGRLSLQTDQIHQTLIIWFLSHVAFRRFCG